MRFLPLLSKWDNHSEGLSVLHLHLEALQHIQYLFMEGLVEGIGAGGIHGDGGFGVFALEHHGVADHADVADQAHKLDFIGSFGQHRSGGRVCHIHAEDQLVYAGGFHLKKGPGCLAVDLPAAASFDAVDHGKKLRILN